MPASPTRSTSREVVNDHTKFRPPTLADPESKQYKELRVAHAQMTSKAANPEFPRLHEWTSYRYIEDVLKAWFDLPEFGPYVAVVQQAYLAKTKEKEETEAKPRRVPDFGLAMSVPGVHEDEPQASPSPLMPRGSVKYQDPLKEYCLPAIIEVKPLPRMDCSTKWLFTYLINNEFEEAKAQLALQALALFQKYPTLNEALLFAMIGDFWEYCVVTRDDVKDLGGTASNQSGPGIHPEENEPAVAKTPSTDQEEDESSNTESDKDLGPERAAQRKQPPRSATKTGKYVYDDPSEISSPEEDDFVTYFTPGSHTRNAEPVTFRDITEEHKAPILESYEGFEDDALLERGWSLTYIYNTPASNQMQFILAYRMRKTLKAALPNSLLGTATANIAASMPVPWDDDWHSAVEGPSSDQEGHDRPGDSSDPGEGTESEEDSEDDEDEEDLMDMSLRRDRNSPTRTVEMASPSSIRDISSPVHHGGAGTLASPSSTSDMSTSSSSMPFVPLPHDRSGSPTPGSSTPLRVRPLAGGSPGQPGGHRRSRLQRLNERGERFYPEVEDRGPDSEKDTESDESKD